LSETLTHPAPPTDVAERLATCPLAARPHVTALRALILDTAASLPEVGVLTETLKWRQPSYATQASKSGTPIRLGWDADTGNRINIFVHCQTTLVDQWRQQYGDDLTFIGTREIAIPTDKPLPIEPLRHCIAMALTYHSRKERDS